MQFKVPQNIDMEDKIVGPLTLIQFLYLLGGGILIYILLVTLGGGFFFWLLAIPLALLALGLAFLKIQDQPLSHFIVAGISYLRNPKIRIWQKNPIPPILKEAPKVKKVVVIAPKKMIDKSQLDQLAYTLDTRQTPVMQTKNFGKITKSIEKLLVQGGNVGAVSQSQRGSRQHAGSS